MGQVHLDLLAAEASRALTMAGVDHLLLKGPTTARWLYSPPRTYSDVDLLVRASHMNRAVRVLASEGIARTRSGFGQESPHSLVMESPRGLEIDLHATLPGLGYRHAEAPDRLWEALSPHVVPFPIDESLIVPSLDPVGRCVVVALHAVEGGFDREQPREDLRLARARVDTATWAAAAELATRIRARDIFDDAGAVLDPARTARSSFVRLKRSGGGATAYALERLLGLSWRGRLSMLRRELFPSVELLRAGSGAGPEVGYSRLYVRRFLALARQLPGATRQLRQIRRR